ncbi:SCO2584 family spore wall biosynthesis protein [Streptomyces sp. NEAU-174]|uniref:SCO2584 family spore wall biosynthesis protein n=1 Tax=Streptomyces sp. NEAU-174 TaxID=3458254 RepID=UPI00404438C8
MPDDVGGKPFPDGDEPDDRSHGETNDEFAAVVFDEDFVRSAPIHEPTAIERMLAAAEARAEAEASRRGRAGVPPEDELFEDGFGAEADFYGADDPDRFGPGRGGDDAYGPYGRYGSAGRPYRGHARWHRPVAWLLAVLMGIGVVALAFTAVYRGASGNRQDPAPPPATSGVDGSPSGQPRLEPSGSESAQAPTGAKGSPASAVPPSQ